MNNKQEPSKGRELKLSKSLSYILRHGAKKNRIPVRSDGFALVDDILQLTSFQSMQFTTEEVLFVVKNNDKQRFAVQTIDNKLYIRANQGHSEVEVPDLEKKKITDPSQYPTVIHGTYFKAWTAIKKTGLNRMGRQYIHMAAGTFGTVISGMRSSSEVLIYIDLAKALNDGIEFFESTNGVIETQGVDGTLATKYFSHVQKAETLEPFDPDFPNQLKNKEENTQPEVNKPKLATKEKSCFKCGEVGHVAKHCPMKNKKQEE